MREGGHRTLITHGERTRLIGDTMNMGINPQTQ